MAGKTRRRPADPLDAIAIRSVEDARAAVGEHVKRGVDWIKLYPTGAYSFTTTGEARYELTYPLPVLQALVEETHRLGRKTACHSFGGDGLEFTITAGCDTVEHGYGLTQQQLDTIVKKGLAYDPTFVRYTEPYMDDNDAKNTGGKFRMIPDLRASGEDGRGNQGAQGDGRQRRRRLYVRARRAGARVRVAGEACRHGIGQGDSGRHDRQCRGHGLAARYRLDHQRASSRTSWPSPAIPSPTSPNCSA